MTKFNPGGNAHVYSTYLGGGDEDAGYALAVDGEGAAYVSGQTFSTNFPTTSAYQGGNGGGALDAFVAKLGLPPTAVALAWLRAVVRPVGVSIRWRTVAETKIVGFNVYRGQARLNRALIPARATMAGGSYAFVDRTAPRGMPLRYRLQSVQLDGRRRWAGTVLVAAR